MTELNYMSVIPVYKIFTLHHYKNSKSAAIIENYWQL